MKHLFRGKRGKSQSNPKYYTRRHSDKSIRTDSHRFTPSRNDDTLLGALICSAMICWPTGRRDGEHIAVVPGECLTQRSPSNGVGLAQSRVLHLGQVLLQICIPSERIMDG